jgi:hypothetical protein
LKGRQYACPNVACQRRRKAANQRSWKARDRVRRRAVAALETRGGTYDGVLPGERGDSIATHVPALARVDDRVLPAGRGDSIATQVEVLAGLVARVLPVARGDSIFLSRSELHTSGRRLLERVRVAAT